MDVNALSYARVLVISFCPQPAVESCVQQQSSPFPGVNVSVQPPLGSTAQVTLPPNWTANQLNLAADASSTITAIIPIAQKVTVPLGVNLGQNGNLALGGIVIGNVVSSGGILAELLKTIQTLLTILQELSKLSHRLLSKPVRSPPITQNFQIQCKQLFPPGKSKQRMELPLNASTPACLSGKRY